MRPFAWLRIVAFHIHQRGTTTTRNAAHRASNIVINCGPRMAGMRPFVLCEEFASAYYDLLAAADCPSSQIAIDKLSAVPLWKVIVGSRRLTANRARKGPVFFFHSAGCAPAASAFTFSRARTSVAHLTFPSVSAASPS